MNCFKGIIKSIDTSGSLSLVRVDVQGILFSTIIIDTPESLPHLKSSNSVNVIFKESEVILAKTPLNISLQNRVPGIIRSIDPGKLLTKVYVETALGDLVALITSNAVSELDLVIGCEVLALIKTNEVMLSYD